MECIVARDGGGGLWWKRDENLPFRRVHPVDEVCHLLKRSRRQVYRQVERGELRLCDRFGGDLLIDAESVNRLREAPHQRQPVPKRLGALFPEHDLSDLNVGRHRTLIVSRVLEEGTPADLRWMLRRYEEKAIREFLEREGERMLSRRAFNLWRRVFSAKTGKRSWRTTDEPWRTRVR
jgi:hypothetical protein